MQLRKRAQRGDTIVEVLIAIAVIGAVLSGAYVVVNSNTRNSQSAQERSTAVKLAESQLELLRSYVVTNDALPTDTQFCLSTTGGAIDPPRVITGTIPAPDTAAPGYPAQCKVDGLYAVGIQAATSNRFTVYVAWDSLSGGRAQVSIAYKVYVP